MEPTEPLLRRELGIKLGTARPLTSPFGIADVNGRNGTTSDFCKPSWPFLVSDPQALLPVFQSDINIMYDCARLVSWKPTGKRVSGVPKSFGGLQMPQFSIVLDWSKIWLHLNSGPDWQLACCPLPMQSQMHIMAYVSSEFGVHTLSINL